MTATGPSFGEREDVRLYVSQALQIICAQTKKILANTGKEAGHPDPCMGDHGDLDEVDDMDDGLFDDHVYLGRFSSEEGHRRVSLLKDGSKAWLPMLLNAFVATHTSKRNHIQSAISAYSCVCDSAVVSKVFKFALVRLMKVANQLKTGELGKDAVLDGGDSDTERYCTYLESVYALLGGLDANALSIVYQLVSNDMDERDPAVQKKAYKIFQYLMEHRPDFYAQDFEGLIERTLQGGATAMSASRGFRIKCLKSIILHLLSDQQNIDLDKIPSLNADEVANPPGAASVNRARVVMTPLVAEIVLSIKESNKKTRAAAFDLVIEVARAMDESNEENGVVSMVHLIIGGLVGSTSQMVSASVMALARMMFEFTPNMVPMIHDLLPAVLMLLQSKSREVIKAVLGFLKIVIMRLDSKTLLDYTPQILEGALIWAEDSKNKFRLKVRVILERLAKKVGFEALERYIPESHRPLLTHIRKETKRKDRLKSARSEMDWDGQSFADTVGTKGGRSHAVSKDPSTWQSDVFSQDSAGKSSVGLGRKSTRSHAKQLGAGITAVGATGEPLNLLEGSTIRRLVGMNVRRSGHVEKERMAEDAITFNHGDDGKLIINDESKKRSREVDDEYDESDEDSDDVILRGITGQELALRGSQSMAKAASYAGLTSRHADRQSKKKVSRGSSISGDRFKSIKAGGDVKGKSKVEPFAYWPLDRRLMNRRQHKTKAAKDALKAVVNAGGKRRKKA
jgi:ribosomal RNA-processing protein 12